MSISVNIAFSIQNVSTLIISFKISKICCSKIYNDCMIAYGLKIVGIILVNYIPEIGVSTHFTMCYLSYSLYSLVYYLLLLQLVSDSDYHFISIII